MDNKLRTEAFQKYLFTVSDEDMVDIETDFNAGWDACSAQQSAELTELRQANERLVKALADIRMIEALYQVGVNIKGESRIGRIAREAIAATPAPRNVVGSKE